MSDLKVLYALTYKDENTVIVNYIKKKMETEMVAARLSLAKIEMVGTKQQIEDMLDAEHFDVLIVKEQLGDDKISSGSIKGWSQRYPNLKVFLSVGNDKKGGEKLLKLLSNPPYYYNALYNNDLTGDNIAKLLASPRTKEEAICYYGLEKRMEEEKAKEEASAAAVIKEEVKAEEKVVEPQVVEVPVKEEPVEVVAAPVQTEPEVTAQELEDMVSGFDDMEMEKMLDEVLQERNEEPVFTKPEEKEEPETIGFNFDTMFSEKDLFGSSVKEPEMVVEELLEEEEIQEIVEEVSVTEDALIEEVEKPVFEECKKQTEEPKVIKGLEDVFVTKTEDVLPENGKVLKVFDHNTMLMELSPAPCFVSGKSMEDYKMFFVVKGTRGGFVGGKYKVGVKSFEGYAGSLLGKQTVIVEVPEYDLVANNLNDAECSIICIEQ